MAACVAPSGTVKTKLQKEAFKVRFNLNLDGIFYLWEATKDNSINLYCFLSFLGYPNQQLKRMLFRAWYWGFLLDNLLPLWGAWFAKVF